MCIFTDNFCKGLSEGDPFSLPGWIGDGAFYEGAF